MKTYRAYRQEVAVKMQQLEIARQEYAPTILYEVQECVREYGFTVTDVFGEHAQIKARRKAKYLNPETGQTWAGTGLEPKWIRGKDRSKFKLP
ncbi:H-NS family nucleoid-associated regulatory protein [Paraburkholderia megapolitana]|uniref:H-NS family nucleoid-associated regulatory protein n=1 Tax=Paraburkholderia megapolitana TaxID=420953 RepID=UPI0038BC5285